MQFTLASVLDKQLVPEDLHQVKTWATEHGFGYFMQTFLPTSDPAINDKFGVSPEEHQAFQKELDWLEGRVGEVVWRDANPFTESKQARCYKGITTVKIFYNGNVRSCWTSRVIGNLFEKSFSEIWTSEEARSMGEFIRDRRCNFDYDVFESLELPNSGASVQTRT